MKTSLTILLMIAMSATLLAQTTAVVEADVAYSGAMYYFHQRKVARTPNGTLMVVWATGNTTGSQVQYSVYDAGFGIWSPASAISNAGYDAIQPAVASDESGNIHAVWQQRATSGDKYQTFYAKYASNSWSTPVQISIAASVRGEEATIEVASDGTLWVVYNNDGEGVGNEYLYVVNSTDGGASWSTLTQTISSGGTFGSSIEVGRTQLSAGPNGRMVALWDNSLSGTEARREVFINTFDGFGWGTAERISDTTTVDRDHSRYIGVAVDASSNIYAFYGLPIVSGADPRLSYLVMHKNAWGTPWSTTYTVAIDSSASNYLSVSAVADSDNVLHLAYRRDNEADTTYGLDEIVYRYSVDAGMTWSTPVVISRPNHDGGYVSMANRVRKAYGIDIAWREARDENVSDGTNLSVVYANVPYSTTSVRTIDAPISYDIFTNYLNPFNPSTNISFTLQQKGEVTLSIYDAMGRQVRILQSGSMGAGSHVLAWDGKSEQGLQMATGVYFSRLVTSDQVQTIRLLLLK